MSKLLSVGITNFNDEIIRIEKITKNNKGIKLLFNSLQINECVCFSNISHDMGTLVKKISENEFKYSHGAYTGDIIDSKTCLEFMLKFMCF